MRLLVLGQPDTGRAPRGIERDHPRRAASFEPRQLWSTSGTAPTDAGIGAKAVWIRESSEGLELWRGVYDGPIPGEGDDLRLSSADGRPWLVHRVERQDERIAIYVRKTGAPHSPRLVKHHMTVPPDGPLMADRRRLVLVATVLGSSMAFLDAFVVNVALPTIDDELGLGLTGEQWMFLSYSLALAALYLPAGALGDRYGYANTFVIGVVGFAAASALAGLAPTSEVLIAARAIQGIFGALLTPGSLALLRATYKDDAGRAIGAWTAWTSAATVAGPVVGGAVVEAVSWRGIFLLNIPVAVVTIVAALASRDKCRTETRHRHLDVYGAVLGAISVGALVWALVEGPESGFGSASVVGGFVLAGVAFTAFLWVESRLAEPMMPLSLFRIRELSVANLATFFVYAALGSALFFVALFAQSVLGYSPIEAGLLFVPVSIVLWALASRFGRGPTASAPVRS